MNTSPETCLFTTRQLSGRLLYKLYLAVFVAAISSLFYYRLTHIPSDHRLLWLLISLAEFWFAAMWFFQQGFRWAPAFHTTYPDRLPTEHLPKIDVMVCTADPDREPPSLVANTLLSLMAYDYNVNKLAYYLSDDGGSELTFHAAYQASIFAKYWLPFCRKYNIEPRAPQAYFSTENSIASYNSHSFRLDYSIVKKKFEEMNDQIEQAGTCGKVTNETRERHMGFSEWESKVDPSDHESIIKILLRGDGGDLDADGNPMPTLVYLSREKRLGHPHHYKAGALNAMNRVSEVISNAPFIINVDCDMHSNNSKALRHAMCFFLDPKVGYQIGFVQFQQGFLGLTENDLYANSGKRVYEVEMLGMNGHNGPFYAGTGAVHRRQSLNGKKFTPDFRPNLDEELVGENKNWNELEEKAKTLTRCTYEQGKPWGKEMGVMYGSAVEDVFTGMVLHSKGWKSVLCSPERKAYLGYSPVNANDSLIQHKRWTTGLLELFLSGFCPWTYGVGRLTFGHLLCYTAFSLWGLWSFPILAYGLLPPLAMVNAIPIFPMASDPWFKLFVFLGIAPHAYSLLELMWVKGKVRMWWNETRMWMMRGSSSYFFSIISISLKLLGLSEPGFEVTSKVIDKEALKRYKEEVMEFAVASPMFIPPTTLSLLNLYCFLRAMMMTIIRKDRWVTFDHMALQIIICGCISLISMPLYEALFLRRDKGRMPTSITIYSIGLSLALLYLL
ncbi:cellulose synthase-like protein E6 isoform X2 [Magnolia sinica]|uniref:cellulose synthase-like protein E6 isoform X2 n=1 Tax=Magnolia sinica TaxID=86752 RepID=UPI0026597423|nr:cellulose synthase-like protein E6 isoform X2 [Magnolia sinica]